MNILYVCVTSREDRSGLVCASPPLYSNEPDEYSRMQNHRPAMTLINWFQRGAVLFRKLSGHFQVGSSGR